MVKAVAAGIAAAIAMRLRRHIGAWSFASPR